MNANFIKKCWERFTSAIRDNRLVFLLILLYVFFYNFWETLIAKHIVDPWLCHFESNTLNDVIFYFAVLACLILAFLHRRKHFKSTTVIICTISIFIWFYYRFISHRFGFISLHSFNALPSDPYALKYVDIVPIYSFSFILSAICEKFLRRSISFSNNGFLRDDPINYLDINDKSKRYTLAFFELSQLIDTNTKDCSFAYGIDAPWGAGKTSFMNIMKLFIRSGYKNVIVIDFNPWLYAIEKDLVTSFFQELSKHLKQYDQSIAKNLIDYSKLLSAFDTKETKMMASLINLNHHESSLQEKKKQINKTIKRINKRIVVFIDDLDRLDTDELMEMLKLIRNISDFPYMYFVAAYDKTYLAKCLEGKMKETGTLFIEKIFQHEFHLPAVPFATLRESLFNCITTTIKTLNESDKKELKTIIDDYGETNPLNVLSNYREVKRLANHFISSYTQIVHENKINVVDLLVFVLFKVKFPLAFNLFEKNWMTILINDNDKKYYYLHRLDGTNYQDPHMDFKEYLRNHREEFCLSQMDSFLIELIMNRLFPCAVDEKKEDFNKRIFSKSGFNHYINLIQLGSDITSEEFNGVINNNNEKLQERIGNWMNNHQTQSLLIHLLEYQVESSEERDRIVKSIFIFISKLDSWDPINLSSNINHLMLLRLGDLFKKDFNKKIFKKVFTENGCNDNICGFLFYLYKNNELFNIDLTKKDYIDIQQRLFNQCKSSDDIDIVLSAFCALLGIIVIRNQRFQVNTSDKYVDKIVKSMRTYAKSHICELIPFLVVKKTKSDKYELSQLAEIIWGSWDSFYKYIDKKNDESRVFKKFKGFIDEYKKKGYKCVQFQFEGIIEPKG